MLVLALYSSHLSLSCRFPQIFEDYFLKIKSKNPANQAHPPPKNSPIRKNKKADTSKDMPASE